MFKILSGTTCIEVATLAEVIGILRDRHSDVDRNAVVVEQDGVAQPLIRNPYGRLACS